MWEGWRSRKESTQRVFVMRGIVKRFAMASATKALRIVEPFTWGSGMIFGFAAGDLVEDDIFGVLMVADVDECLVLRRFQADVIKLLVRGLCWF